MVLEAAIFLLIVLVFSVYVVSAAGGFNCTIVSSGSCGGGNTSVIYLENDTGGYWNAHAQNVSDGTYDYVICCNSSSSLSYACGEGVFLKLQGAYQFDKCMNITISNAGSSTLTNFPAYVNLTHDNDMLPDFRDIRFYDKPCNQGGSLLDYEIENYTTNDRAHVWVRIPSLPSSGTNISIYYKNNSVVSSGENPEGVWDSYYKGVWHMTESNATDSTSNNNDGNESGGVTINSSGEIDSALAFDGDDDYVQTSYNFSGLADFTVSVWVYTEEEKAYGSIWSNDGSAATCQGEGIYFTSSTNLRYRIADNVYDFSIGDITGKWVHIVATEGSASAGRDIYLDGVSLGPGSAGSDTNGDIGFQIGGYNDCYRSGETDTFFDGLIDEVRVSSINRSAEWINQSYQMVANQGDFVSFDSEEAGPGVLKGSHVQRGDYSGPGTVYGVDVCLSVDPGYFNCTYVDDACPGDRECFASMGGANSSDNNTNAHIGPCEQYRRKICCRSISEVTVTYENPTPGNGTRQIANSVTINVSVTTDSIVSADTCILEWKEGAGDPQNETMEMVGSGSSVFCNVTKSTNDGTTYYFRVYANDSNGNLGNESQRQFRENDEPGQVVLSSPASGSHFTNRTPVLKWNEPNDADGDPLTYFVNMSCLKLGGGDCSSDDRYASTTDLNYTPPTELQYFGDDNYYYNWSVKAYDGYQNGTESDKWNFTVDTNVSISIDPDVVDFGEDRPLGYEDNTTDDSPNPFGLHNDGNCMIDANISALGNLWYSKPSPTDHFNYSVGWFSNEIGAFNWTGSTTGWTNVPMVNVTFICYLNYSDTNDSAEVDLEILVPPDEIAGAKSSNLIFTGWYVGEE